MDLVGQECRYHGDIDMDSKRPHDVHSYQNRGRFGSDDYDKTCSSFWPRPIVDLGAGFSRYLERFAMCAVDDPLERLQGTALGAVLPPHR